MNIQDKTRKIQHKTNNGHLLDVLIEHTYTKKEKFYDKEEHYLITVPKFSMFGFGLQSFVETHIDTEAVSYGDAKFGQKYYLITKRHDLSNDKCDVMQLNIVTPNLD